MARTEKLLRITRRLSSYGCGPREVAVLVLRRRLLGEICASDPWPCRRWSKKALMKAPTPRQRSCWLSIVHVGARLRGARPLRFLNHAERRCGADYPRRRRDPRGSAAGGMMALRPPAEAAGRALIVWDTERRRAGAWCARQGISPASNWTGH